MNDTLFENKFIIGSMRWSFSRLSSFHTCPLEWEWKYINCNRGCDSAFGQFGSFNHKILEMYYKGELDFFDLCNFYEEHYEEEVNLPFPRNAYTDLAQSYYDKGLAYWESFDLTLDDYEILGVEKPVEFKIDNYEFIGYIDLLLRHKETGEITILDHKSASIKVLKSGKISKSDQAHFLDFQRQLYLYSIPVIKEYGRVDHLTWNLFKDQNSITIPFNEDDFEAAKKWAIDTIHEIENTVEYIPDPSYYYCSSLCSTRMSDFYCPYKYLGMIYDGIYSKCYSQKNKDYYEYGAAGITLCDEWKSDKQKFFKWCLDSGYEQGLRLARYDIEEGFSPDNCYWDYNDEED